MFPHSFKFAFILVTLMGLMDIRPVSAGTLSGSFASIAVNSVVNLTTNGPLDWVHWGLYTETSLNRKAGVLPRIGDFTAISGSGTNAFVYVYQFGDLAHGYRWTDGTPESSVDDTHTGVWAYGVPNVGTGFEFSVPADTTERTLRVYVGVFSGKGDVEATLSDGSAAAYSNNTLSSTRGSTNRVYVFSYAADAPGQTLRIRWKLQMGMGTRPDANVTLQAATLAMPGGNNPPSVLLTAPANNASLPLGSTISLTANANDFDGSVARVEFFADGNKIGEDTSSPYSASWHPTTTGRYSLTAEATDNGGAAQATLPVEVFVYGTGGTLSGSVATPPAQLNLTAEGPLDWTHWGLTSANSFNRKSGVTPLLGDFTKIGSNPVMQYSNNFTRYSWSDGTPVSSASGTPTGVFITGQDSGFALTIPADTTTRRLKLYVGGYGVQANFQAWLDDFSAAAYTDTSVSNVYGDSYAVYTIDFASASASGSLQVQYRADTLFDRQFGNVTLQAATLSGPAPPAVILITNAHLNGSSFTFSFPTEIGKSYSAQAAPSLSAPIDWQTFTSVTGNGSLVTVTNLNLAPEARFYRVHQP